MAGTEALMQPSSLHGAARVEISHSAVRHLRLKPTLLHAKAVYRYHFARILSSLDQSWLSTRVSSWSLLGFQWGHGNKPREFTGWAFKIMSGTFDERDATMLEKRGSSGGAQPRLAKASGINHGLLLPLNHFFSTVPV